MNKPLLVEIEINIPVHVYERARTLRDAMNASTNFGVMSGYTIPDLDAFIVEALIAGIEHAENAFNDIERADID